MQKEFLELYHDELHTFRRRAAAFSLKHPEAAARLRLADGIADDPHVERLIESFAFTSARIRHKLEDSFPELSAGMLDALYPHLIAPQPSMSLVRLMPPADITTVQHVPRYFELLSEEIQGDKCRFRTTQAVDIIPAKITSVRYETDVQAISTAQSALIIRLSALKRQGNLGSAGLKTLRFHLSGAWDPASLLYMRIFSNTVGIKISGSDGTTEHIFLPPDYIRAVGFSDEESLLPLTTNLNTGLRLLSEFFALKRKFLFFDIFGLEKFSGKDLEITIYFNEKDLSLQKQISLDSLNINTTPIINLFSQRCEPINIGNQRLEYALIPDYRFLDSRKIHSVEHVHTVINNETPIVCNHAYTGQNSIDRENLFWQLVRCSNEDDTCKISFIGKSVNNEQQIVARIDALCTNGILPSRLPYSIENLQLMPAAPHNSVLSAHCIMPFSPSIEQPPCGEQLWKFISHLRLSYISAGGDNGNSLKNILHLYNKGEFSNNVNMIESIYKVNCVASMCRIKQGGFANATDFNIYFSENKLSTSDIFIFSKIINRFLNSYTSINSFSRVTAWIENNSVPIVRFPFNSSLRYSI